jgi:hypothetical protein
MQKLHIWQAVSYNTSALRVHNFIKLFLFYSRPLAFVFYSSWKKCSEEGEFTNILQMFTSSRSGMVRADRMISAFSEARAIAIALPMPLEALHAQHM